MGLLLSSPTERAGIAIIGTGGAAALDRVTALDSATGHFIVVTRPECPATCAALDSASGTIPPADVARIFALIEEEHLFALRDDYEFCPHCDADVVQVVGEHVLILAQQPHRPLSTLAQWRNRSSATWVSTWFA